MNLNKDFQLERLDKTIFLADLNRFLLEFLSKYLGPQEDRGASVITIGERSEVLAPGEMKYCLVTASWVECFYDTEDRRCTGVEEEKSVMVVFDITLSTPVHKETLLNRTASMLINAFVSQEEELKSAGVELVSLRSWKFTRQEAYFADTYRLTLKVPLT